MLDTEGTVIGREEGYAVVELKGASCGRCHEAGGCGGHSLSHLFCRTPRVFRVRDTGKASLGERVTVVIQDGAVQKSAVRLYVFPLLMLLVGAGLGLWFLGELGSMLGGLIGLLVAYFTLYRKDVGSQEQGCEPYIRR